MIDPGSFSRETKQAPAVKPYPNPRSHFSSPWSPPIPASSSSPSPPIPPPLLLPTRRPNSRGGGWEDRCGVRPDIPLSREPIPVPSLVSCRHRLLHRRGQGDEQGRRGRSRLCLRIRRQRSPSPRTTVAVCLSLPLELATLHPALHETDGGEEHGGKRRTDAGNRLPLLDTSLTPLHLALQHHVRCSLHPGADHRGWHKKAARALSHCRHQGLGPPSLRSSVEMRMRGCRAV